MTITVGTDTYVTVAEADQYFAARFGYESWVALDEPTKEKLLVSATQQLDILCLWYGEKVVSDQLLAFPRNPYANPTPQQVKDSQCEIAFNINTTGSTSTDSGDPLTELKAGSVTLKFEAGTSDNPLVNDLTASLLSSFGLCSGTGSTKIIPIGRT